MLYLIKPKIYNFDHVHLHKNVLIADICLCFAIDDAFLEVSIHLKLNLHT